MKKLFLLLFVLSLLIVNVNARDIRLQPFRYTVQQTTKVAKETIPPYVTMNPSIMMRDPKKIECIDGDTIHVSHIYTYTDEEVLSDWASYSFRIAGIDAFDSKSRKMIEKQKKATGLSEAEIKKKAQEGKKYCEEYFIKQKKCLIFYVHGLDHYGRIIVIPCEGEYERNLFDKGLATIYKGNDLYKLIFDEDY